MSHCKSSFHPVSHFLIIWGIHGLFSTIDLLDHWKVACKSSPAFIPPLSSSRHLPPNLPLVFPSSLSDFCLFLVCPRRDSFYGCRIPEVSDSFRGPTRRQGARSRQVIFFILSSLLLRRGTRKSSVFEWIWLFCVWEGAEPRSRPPSPPPQNHMLVWGTALGGCYRYSDCPKYAETFGEATEAGSLSCEWKDPPSSFVSCWHCFIFGFIAEETGDRKLPYQ